MMKQMKITKHWQVQVAASFEAAIWLRRLELKYRLQKRRLPIDIVHVITQAVVKKARMRPEWRNVPFISLQAT